MLLMDENKVPGFFFPFADIGINCSGKFRLRFDLYDISMATSNRPVANIISDVIQVFSGQQFTGMESTLTDDRQHTHYECFLSARRQDLSENESKVIISLSLSFLRAWTHSSQFAYLFSSLNALVSQVPFHRSQNHVFSNPVDNGQTPVSL
ncbi:hypothetical protein EDD86DRAFT_202794 [Gorgonomyces haynaldii]|nr:hypothetical protein EDD86DRAFT_202794 [Gorgonomyces haynaldii]